MRRLGRDILQIGIDGRALIGPLAGTGRYVRELCRVLDAVLPEARFLVLCNRRIALPVENARWSLAPVHARWEAQLSPFSWFLLRAGRLAAAAGVDVLWGGANFLPLAMPAAVRGVVTVHDLVYRVFPQSMGFKHRLAYDLFFRASMRRADVLVTNSLGTSRRLRECGFRGADEVVRPGASRVFAPPAAVEIATMRRALELGAPYILSVSTLEPRKNLPALVQAFLGMRRSGELPGMDLVLVGQEGWKNESLAACLREAGDAAKAVRFAGYVPDEMLPALYAGAEAMVMPSLYEGFGMPVLEARLCGARVVATDIPELREAGGEGVVYIPPTVQGIQAGIREALSAVPVTVPAGEVPRWESEGKKLADLFCRMVRSGRQDPAP